MEQEDVLEPGYGPGPDLPQDRVPAGARVADARGLREPGERGFGGRGEPQGGVEAPVGEVDGVQWMRTVEDSGELVLIEMTERNGLLADGAPAGVWRSLPEWKTSRSGNRIRIWMVKLPGRTVGGSTPTEPGRVLLERRGEGAPVPGVGGP